MNAMTNSVYFVKRIIFLIALLKIVLMILLSAQTIRKLFPMKEKKER